MKSLLRAVRLLCFLALAGGGGLAHALTVAQLQALLQATPRSDASYVETRESPWLAAPVTTRGTLHVTAQSLEKRVQEPRPETWRMLEDRLEWEGPGGAGRKQIFFRSTPALQALADATRRAIAGELVALQRDFTIVVSGDEHVWSAQLQPRSSAVAHQVDSVQLQGTGGHLRVLIVSDRQGERTTTRILP